MRYRSLRAQLLTLQARYRSLLAMLPTNVSDFDELDDDAFDSALADMDLIAAEMAVINDAQRAILDGLARHRSADHA
jgi:hypothetical protein